MEPNPIFLPGEPHGQKSLVGYGPKGCRLLDIRINTKLIVSN